MSPEKTPTSDRFQILTAVLFMSLFAALFLLVAVPKGAIRDFVCNYIGEFNGMCSDQPSSEQVKPVASRINSACVDSQGLRISVGFEEPLAGTAAIQVFSTGPDFFPSDQGMTDTYAINQTMTAAVDHLDLVIPVDSMPVGEQIFGNISVSEEGSYSHVAFILDVSDCSTTSNLPSTPTVTGVPTIQSATCLPSRQLMIAFEFEGPVLGQYQALISDIPYQLSSVVSQPTLLFFSGEPPPNGPIVISLVSATDQVVVFEETYTPPICGST